MAQLVVRNIDDFTKAQLQRRARLHGRSMEEEVSDILRSAVYETEERTGGLGSEIAKLFAITGLESDIPELTESPIKPQHF